MLVQCPPCSTRYRISAQRIGADGRALSRCVACGTWLVVHRLDSGLLEIRTADELVGQRSILALDYADLAESVSERATMPMTLAPDELPEEAFLSVPDGADLGIVRIEDSDGPSDWRPSMATEVQPVEPRRPASASGSFFPTAASAPPDLPSASPDLGALGLEMPDPRRRRRSRVEVQVMLSEFSVMFRLDSRAKRRRTLIAGTVVVLICVLLVAVAALRGGTDAPLSAEETRTLVTTLQASHTDPVEHAAKPGKDGKATKHKLSLLATQLLQLQKSTAQKGAAEPVNSPAATPGPGPAVK